MKELKDYREFFEADLVLCEDSPHRYLPWAREHYGEWLSFYHKKALMYQMNPSLIKDNENADVFLAFSNHCGYGYRHPSEGEKKIMDTEFQTDIALLKDNIVVHRVTNYVELLRRCGIHTIARGERICVPGYMSTALVKSRLVNHPEYMSADTHLRIYAPAGSRCLYMGDISHRDHESEMLFARDTILEIVDVVSNDQHTDIVARVVV